MKQHTFRVLLCLLGGAAVFSSIAIAVPGAESGGSPSTASLVPSPESSLLVLPVRLHGSAAPRVAEVIALMLEGRGLHSIDVEPAAVATATNAGTPGETVREILRKHPATADFVLYAEFEGTRQGTLNELRAVLVNPWGKIVWNEHLTPADPGFAKIEPRDPLSMAVALVDRIAPLFGLTEETARAAKPGRFARIMEERSGLPPIEERLTFGLRVQKFVANRDTARITVFPLRVQGRPDTSSAVDLARKLGEAKIGRTCEVTLPLVLPPPTSDPNELKRLWDLAREFRAHLKAHPIDGDYALMADVAFNPGRWEEGFVHLVLCTADGEWVMVDLQNSHHPDFQALKPARPADANALIVRRVQDCVAKVLRDSSQRAAPASGPGPVAGLAPAPSLP